MLQTVNVKFYTPGGADPERFERLFEQVADALHDRLDAMDPSVGATVAEGFLDVMLTVDAPPGEVALMLAVATIREALQAAGIEATGLVLKSAELLEPA